MNVSLSAASLSLSLACAIAGCREELEVHLPLPPIGAESAMLTGVEERNALVSLYASALGGRAATLPVTQDEQKIHVVAFLYERTLDALDLSEGQHTSEPNGGAIPAPDAAYQLFMSQDGTREDWSPFTSTEELLASHLVPTRATECVRFELSTFELGTVEHAVTGARLDATSGVVITEDAKIFRVDRRGATLMRDYLPPTDVAVGSFRRADDELYFAGYEGRVWKSVGGAQPFERFAQNPSRTAMRWIDGAASSELFELYTFGTTGLFERFDGTTWTTLNSDVPAGPRGAVAWIAPGHAIAAISEDAVLLRYRDGMVRTESPGEGRLGFSVARHVPGLGTVIGDEDGRVLLDANADGDWKLIGELGAGLVIHAVTPFGSGFLVGGSFGLFAQYVDGFGFCDRTAAPSHVRAIVPVGDDLLLAYFNNDNAPNPGSSPTLASWLHR